MTGSLWRALFVGRVKDCACVGVSPAGEPAGDDVDIRVFLQSPPGVSVDLDAVIQRLGETLPRYMLPRYFDVVDELPRTPKGKLQRQDLRDRPLTERTRNRVTFSDVL